jgi:hypothetical protein
MIDETFGDFGMVITDVTPPDASGKAILVDHDNNMIIGGYTGNIENSDLDFTLLKYNINGDPDYQFGDNGKVVTSINSIDAIACLCMQPDHKIIAAGISGDESHLDFALARYFNILNSNHLSFDANPVHIYPNPVASYLHIQMFNVHTCKVEIHNQIGQMVFTDDFDFADELSVFVGSLVDGIYYLSVITEKSRFSQKFIKN